MIAFLAAVAVSSPAAASAAPSAPILVPVPPPSTISVEQQKLGGQLARIVDSEELTRAQLDKLLNDTMPKTLASDPAFVAMEKEHPGITHAMIEAMRPIIVDESIRRLPVLWARLENIFARSFTAAELKTLIDFYASPTGVRVIKAMGEGSDFSRMLGTMVANDKANVTADDLRAGVQAGAAEVIRTATPEDIKAMEALMATSAGQKMRAVTPQIQAEAVAWGNEPSPETTAKVQKAVVDLVAKYIGKPAQ